MHSLRFSALAPVCLLSLVSAASAYQGSPAPIGPAMGTLWAGETRQVCFLDLDDGAGGTERHVWTVGDGALIRHAVDPDANTIWEIQAPPAGVTQNLLDITFIAGGGGPADPDHIGYACGVNGNVLTTVNYGQTWTHFDQVDVQNQDNLNGPHNATLWRTRFANEDAGFTCGLWTFKGWNSALSQWDPVTLTLPGTTFNFQPGAFEFYAMELIVDPAD